VKEHVADTIREIHKLTPSEGDVIAVKVPPHWDKADLWDIISEIRERGIQIVAFTEDVELTVIKDFHSYLLQVPEPLSTEQMDRIRREWQQYFPKAPIMVQSGGSTLLESVAAVEETTLGPDTL